ncbi:MAG: hypothetical protein OXD39_06450 [Gemmatimonadetes bacterium]|nr:hypothetical protein [Gemmatimonadota bacterium]
MNVYWWQSGIYIEPEGKVEKNAKNTILDNLRFISLVDEIDVNGLATPNRNNQDAVSLTEKGLDILKMKTDS